jgi:hypothetical protein
MKPIILSIALAFAVTPAYASLNDNFDSYQNDTAFNSVWAASTGTGLSLTTGVSVSGPNSVKNPGNNAQSNRRQMDSIYGHELNFSFYFYDFDGGNGRDYASLYARGGSGAWSDTFENALSIGKYDATTPAKYAGRLAVPGDALFGNGAEAGPGGWFALGGAPDRSIGWHKADILGSWDEVNPGKVSYRFLIDDVLGGTISNAQDDLFNWVVLGSGLTTLSPIAIDNVSITAVPEPTMCAMFGIGWILSRCCRRAGKATHV